MVSVVEAKGREKLSELLSRAVKPVPVIAGWGFTKEEIADAERRGGMLMLDTELGTSCRLNCEYCFRTNDKRDGVGRPPMSVAELKALILQAADLGVKSIHLVGAGETLEHKGFFEVIEFMAQNGITPFIFTNAEVIGDDALAQRIHGVSGEAIARRLAELNVSVIVKVNSFNAKVQDGIAGKEGYSKSRDIGFDRLLRAGLNKRNPTSIGLDTVIMRQNLGELMHLFRYCRENNVFPMINTFVPCGQTADDAVLQKINVRDSEKAAIYGDILLEDLKRGIRYEGFTSYAGGHICQQLRFGMYVNVYGSAFACPSFSHEIGNVKERKLVELWNSEHMKEVRAKFKVENYGCPPRTGFSLPKNFAEMVEAYAAHKLDYE